MGKRRKTVCVYALILASALISAQWGSHAVTVIVESAPIMRKHRIVIDPGHGGEDGGATSCTGMIESQYNLTISLRLNDLLHLLGYETKMIRTTDTSVYTAGNTIAQRKASDLRNRVNMTNRTENAVLVSIHQNNFSDPRYSGAQVFYAGTPGSAELAKQLQDMLTAFLNPDGNRKCKRSSGVYLMEHIRCPGILVECGFLSNPEEEQKLQNPVYQKKLCCIIAAVLSQNL